MTIRLFAGPSSQALAVQPGAFTDLERDTMADILRFASDPANAGMELMHCLDADGSVQHDSATGRGGVILTPLMKEAIAAGAGVRLWHNHPSQTSLSHHDWRVTGIPELLEVLALTENGSIYVGRMTKWDDRCDALLKAVPVIAGLLELHMDQAAKARGVSLDAIVGLSRTAGHVMNLAIAAERVVDYAFLLSVPDQALFDCLEEDQVVRAGLDLASAEIRSVLYASA